MMEMEGITKMKNPLILILLIFTSLLPFTLTTSSHGNATPPAHQGKINGTHTRVGGGDAGGGGYSWGWGGGGGGGGGSGGGGGRGAGWGYGWGGGGGGAGWWKWGCGRGRRRGGGGGGDRGVYRVGEFGECMGEGRCKGMRLDCPLHCAGPCFYDCLNMCKPHCVSRRRRPT